MKISKYFLIVSLVLFSTLYGQNNFWQNASQPDIENLMLDIFMVSDTEGWVAGNDGTIFYTNDGFVTIEQQTSNTENNINALFFIDNQTGWAGTKKGDVLRTTNGGALWESFSLKSVVGEDFSFSNLNAIYFLDSNIGYLIAGKSKSNYAFKTTDGGITWQVTDSLITTSRLSWKDIRFYDENNGVIVGDKAGTHKYTTDGGATWEAGDDNLMSFRDNTVRYLSKDTLVCLGEGNAFHGINVPIYKSVDGGKTWNKTEGASTNRIKDLYFQDSKNGIAVGSNGFSSFFVMKTNDAGETWSEQTHDFAVGLLDISSATGSTIYVLGASSHIFKSTDFGDTFEVIKIKTPSGISDIVFKGETGYAVNSNGTLYKSTNNGLDWEHYNTTGVGNVGAMHFTDENTGYILKRDRRIVKTSDGGSTWKEVLVSLPFSSRNRVGGLHFPSANVGYAWVSINDFKEYYVYKTIDAGETWNEVSALTGGGSITGNIQFFDENTGIIGGARIKVDGVNHHWFKYTTDGAATWNDASVTFPDTIDVKSIDDLTIIDENSAIAVSSSAIFKTNDKGKTWEFLNTGIDESISNFEAVDFNGNNGAITTFRGNVIYTYDAGATWELDTTIVNQRMIGTLTISEDNNIFLGSLRGFILNNSKLLTDISDNPQTPVTYSLSQNYPNPFNPTTTISFNLPEKSVVTITVFNILGQVVDVLANNEFTAGSHSINWNAASKNHSSGVYIYEIKALSNNGTIFNQSKKMILMK